MNYYLILFIVALSFTIMDIAWIAYNKTMYFDSISKVQKSEFVVTNVIYLILPFSFMIAGLLVICLSFVELMIDRYPKINKYVVALFAGGFYGIIVNSVYNFTSLAIYKDYSLYTSVTDMIWAFVLYGTVSMIYISLR